MLNQDISKVTPTQGFNIKNLVHDKIKFNFWDIGGQKALRQYWSNYIVGNDALVYVIDSADTVRIKEAGAELESLLGEKDLSGIPLLIYANKQDLVQALPPETIVNLLKINHISSRKWTIIACSASTPNDEGLQEGLNWLVENLNTKK